MATNTLNLRIQLKGDTAANWATSTLVPLKNEMCIESDTRKVKIGDGVNEYPDLKYINLTPEEISALIDAANHTHDNKAILDATTASFTSALLTKLNGIADGANKTVVDSALSSTSTNPVQNKVINTALGNKVDKVTGKALSTNDFTDEYKTKLDGIADGANKYTLPTASSTTLGGVKIGANVSIASGVISVPEGSTSAKGVVQLTNATNSTSTTTAATPSSVKSAYDLANTANTAAATAQSTADSKVGAVSMATGSANGQIALTVDGTTTQASVKGLGSAAYTASSNYATAAQGTKADNAMPKSGGTFTGAVTLNADPTANLGAATKQYVDSQITSKLAASDAMVFKGTLGTDGTVTAVPTTGVVKGDTYKIITAGTYAGNACKVGDLIIALNSGAVEATATNWAYVPSGNENETTIKYSTTTQNLTTSAKTGAITLAEGATKQVDTSISAGSTSTKLPTSAAVASFIEGKGYATNAFSNVTVGSTTIAADSKADTLTIAAGSNITITPDADNDKITISSTNTDTKVTNTLATTTKAYVTGTTTATTNTGTQVFDTGVYLDTTAGMLTAATFKGSLSGNASTATSFASNQSVALTGQVTGSASSKGGWSLATTVNQCSTDALFNGTNSLILNCGSATA